MDSNHENTVISSAKANPNESKAKKLDEIGMKHPVSHNVFDNLPATIVVIDNVTSKDIKLNIISLKEAAHGSFGTVFEGVLKNSKQIAIKKVLQDRKYKNRELEIMRHLNHNNITNLLYFYYSVSLHNSDLYLNLVMDFLSQTLSRILKFYSKTNSFLPMNFVKIYMFQMFRGLNYIHQLDICHRDIKPQNILVDPSRVLLRICDFGSAKKLISTEKHVSYICSRYYRAPELIFGATNYSIAIDIWSAGCVFAEVLLNKPIFPGQTSVDQIVEIIKVLGTPTESNVRDMNPDYKSFHLPTVAAVPFDQIFTNPDIPEDAFFLLGETFKYSPNVRITALKFLAHPFYDSLRDPAFRINIKQNPPPLSDFNELELTSADEEIRNILNKKPNEISKI